MRYAFIFFFSFLLLNKGISQVSNTKYQKTDNFIFEIGPLEKSNVATIADTITSSFSDKEIKARSIYTWIANNIEMDPKAIRSGDNKNTEPENVIKLRKTTPLGFALLFQEMCSQADIRCLVVDGYTKYNAEQINEMPDAINFSWNVVQLGTSPNAWFYVDVAKASGYLDTKQTRFTHKFSGDYFFANKNVFNLDHFPDNILWQLNEGPKSTKDFYSLPLIHEGTYQLGITKPNPMNGFIKTKPTTSNLFSFKVNDVQNITNISIVIGEGAKQQKPERVNFTTKGNEIFFSYIFKKEDTYPMKIMVDGKDVITYLVESSE
jgi:hypothetical protein